MTTPTPPFVPLPPSPGAGRPSALPKTTLPPIAEPPAAPAPPPFAPPAEPDEVTPEEKAHLEDEIVTPEDAEEPAPPAPPSLSVTDNTITGEQSSSIIVTPDEQVREADKPMRTARPRIIRPTPDRDGVDIVDTARAALDLAEANLAAAKRRFHEAEAALGFAQKVADHAHAHPALQEES